MRASELPVTINSLLDEQVSKATILTTNSAGEPDRETAELSCFYLYHTKHFSMVIVQY